MLRFPATSALALIIFIAGCNKSEDAAPVAPPAEEPVSGTKPDASQAQSAGPGLNEAPAAPSAEPSSSAILGKPAPDFVLPTLDGTEIKLSEKRGKTVVLEWFNPECPYVKAAHTKGSLVNTAGELTAKDVVYLAINSGAAGKQGHGAELNKEAKERFKMNHPILLDEAGNVGKSYGATNTPHIFVINPEGVLVYRGAIDNSPDGEGASPKGGALVNYLTQAVDEVLAGKPVSTPETKAYGCSVKYGS